MTTFFFDTDDLPDADDDGLDLPDIEAALAAALQAFPDMIRDADPLVKKSRFCLTVRNRHAPLFRVTLELLSGEPVGESIDGCGNLDPEEPTPTTPNTTPEGTDPMQSQDDLIARVADKHGLGRDAVATALAALRRGNGTMAQFSHAEFGGMAQWSKGGMSMVGDMFNRDLKAKLDGVMSDLAAAPVQQDAGLRDGERDHSEGPSPTGGIGSQWPEEFGAPSSSGGQNDSRYAFFPKVRRLIVEDGGKRTTYDTGTHQISGVSQQQSGSRSLTFQSQDGEVRLADLTIVE